MTEQAGARTDERHEVSRQVDATPAEVFAVLCTPDGHVAIDSSGMLQSAEGDPVRAVGDTFLVHVDRESLGDRPMGEYDVTVVSTRFEQDAALEWTISGTIQPPVQHLYGYRLEPSGTGTLVTSYHDWSQVLERYREAITFPVVPVNALGATLGILARTLRAG